MNTKGYSLAGLCALLPAALLLSACSPHGEASVLSKPDTVSRGKYIVEQVALCVDCHSPRTEAGAFDMDRWLQGSPLPFVPTVSMPWTDVAPPIAGLPGYTREQGIHFFMTGERPTKTPVLPPMPAFRMDRSDAEAVTDYLLSQRAL